MTDGCQSVRECECICIVTIQTGMLCCVSAVYRRVDGWAGRFDGRVDGGGGDGDVVAVQLRQDEGVPGMHAIAWSGLYLL